MMLKIMLVDDHVMIREGLHSLIECQPDMEIIGEAENGRIAIQRAAELKPDLWFFRQSNGQLNNSLQH